MYMLGDAKKIMLAYIEVPSPHIWLKFDSNLELYSNTLMAVFPKIKEISRANTIANSGEHEPHPFIYLFK